jgi:hypothetical protein
MEYKPSTSGVRVEYKRSTAKYERSTSGVQAEYEWSTAEYALSESRFFPLGYTGGGISTNLYWAKERLRM